jgi:hypothetical protein
MLTKDYHGNDDPVVLRANITTLEAHIREGKIPPSDVKVATHRRQLVLEGKAKVRPHDF